VSIINKENDFLFNFHTNPKNLKILTPWIIPLKIYSEESMIENSIAKMKFMLLINWQAQFKNIITNKKFSDLQIKGPFAYWNHTHKFKRLEAGKTELNDEIEFKFRKNPLYFIIGLCFFLTLPLLFKYRLYKLNKIKIDLINVL
jgi:ligand-binding SRPBCC domain-containing protein